MVSYKMIKERLEKQLERFFKRRTMLSSRPQSGMLNQHFRIEQTFSPHQIMEIRHM